MNNHKLLQCTNLCKSYQVGSLHNDVLHNVNFAMQVGEMMAIIGTSGSGKSTLLHLLGGLDSPDSGDVIFKGLSLYSMSPKAKAELRNRQLGFVYQFHHLLADFTALENAAMPLLIGGITTSMARQRAVEILTAVGLGKRMQHRPSELSGGERQRVAIARALINKPALVLADEPTGNLDKRTAAIIFDLLIELSMVKSTACLVVTHDLRLASRFDRQLEMIDGCLQTPLGMKL